MKRIFLFLLLFAGPAGMLAARERVNIDRGWQFSMDGAAESTSVDLPHTWNRDAVSFHRSALRGLGNYMKTVRIPDEWTGKRIYLRCGGADGAADLFVNGRWAGEHRGTYTGFTVEITPLLRFGEANSLWMRVNNAPQLDYLPIGSDFNPYGGIFRGVELIVVDPAHFALNDHGSDGVDLRQREATAQRAQVDAAVRVEAPGEGTYTVEVEVFDPEQNSVAAAASKKIRIDKGAGVETIALSIDDPHLWHGVVDPFLYTCRLVLKEGERALDSLAVPLGLRSFEIRPDSGFFLNGQPYPLRGVTRVEDRAGVGSALSGGMHEQDVALIREMGANAVRMYGYPHSPRFYELCDRAGIVVWSDLPLIAPQFGVDNGYVAKDTFRENGRRQLTEMIRQHGNHACVAFLGLFSNLSGRGTDDPVPYIEELNKLAHELDPSRLTVAASNQDGPINFVTDAIGWSQYLGWKTGMVSDTDLWLSQLTTEWSNLRSAVAEYGAGGSTAHQSEAQSRPDPDGHRHPEAWQTRYHEEFYAILQKYPSIWGSFIHSMFDFGEAPYAGGAEPGVSDLGLVSYDRRERKDAFYFYKANWNTADPFVHIAEKRRAERPDTLQTITLYTNRGEAELIVDGTSQGSKTPVMGICRWENVVLDAGTHTLEARAGEARDAAGIVIGTARRLD